MHLGNTALQVVGFSAGIGTTASFLPQVIKVWKNRSTQDLSVFMFMIHMSGVTLWIVYGLARDDTIIILFNGTTFVLCLFILVAFIRFPNRALTSDIV